MVKKWISLILSLMMVINIPCISIGQAENATSDPGLNNHPDFHSLDDPALRTYIEDSLYENLVSELDSDQYFVENVDAVYISQDYLDELEYNSRANVFFGYTLSELEAQFQGNKYVFTLGENNETVVQPWEDYVDPMGTVIHNVAVGTGVILVCVTVSAVTAGTGAYACSMIFAMAAKGGAIGALSGAAFGGLSAGIVKLVETGNVNEAFDAALLSGSEGYKWGAVTGAISGGASEAIALKGATLSGLNMNQAAFIQKKTKWPLKAIKSLHSIEESEVYLRAGLTPIHMADDSWVFAKQIDWDLIDELGRSNRVRVMEYNLSPIDNNGLSYEVHHIGQKADGPLAMLTHAEHHNKETYSIIHYADEGKDITDSAWRAQKAKFWKSILKLQEGK